MMTKRRIHTIYITLCLFYSVTGAMSFALFLRDFNKVDKCRLFNIVTKTAYLAILVLFFSLGSIFMFLNYIIIICNLTRSKKSMKDIASGTNMKINKNNVKLTRAIIMMLTAYIVFYIPVIVMTSTGTFYDALTVDHLWGILEDIALIFYFSNNLINPFIYYMTLKDFREGYKRLLFCYSRCPAQRDLNINVAVI